LLVDFPQNGKSKRQDVATKRQDLANPLGSLLVEFKTEGRSYGAVVREYFILILLINVADERITIVKLIDRGVAGFTPKGERGVVFAQTFGVSGTKHTIRIIFIGPDELVWDAFATLADDVIGSRQAFILRIGEPALPDAIADVIGSVDGLPDDLSARTKLYLKSTGYGRKRAR
jgi:hypothetical protein